MKQFIFFSLLIFSCFSNAQDLNEIKSKARAGDASAQYQLACEYLYDEENPTNYIEVLRLLRESSEKGNKDAAELIKSLSEDGHDSWGDYNVIPCFYDHGVLSESLIQVLKKEALEGCGVKECKGHKGYLMDIAHSYYNSRQFEKAIKYAKLALSLMQESNLGTDIGETEDLQDFDVYYAWMDAYTMLGDCYEHGYGVSKDLKKAIAYYGIGEDLIESELNAFGVKDLLNELGNEVLTSDVGSEGFSLNYGIMPIISYKHPMLLLKLGLYQYADEYFKDYDKYLTPDSEWDYTHAAPKLLWYGERYFRGLGTQTNYSKAFKVFYAIVHNLSKGYDLYEIYPNVYADACYRLYECYAEGKGVEKNNQKAELYFRQALKFGSSSAIYDSQKYYEASKRDF